MEFEAKKSAMKRFDENTRNGKCALQKKNRNAAAQKPRDADVNREISWRQSSSERKWHFFEGQSSSFHKFGGIRHCLRNEETEM